MVKKTDKLKYEIIAEQVGLTGCTLIFITYISGLILPNFYFSDFFESTIIAFLTFVIFVLLYQRHSKNLKLLAEKKEELEKRQGAVKIVN